jgi:hypothetical protein
MHPRSGADLFMCPFVRERVIGRLRLRERKEAASEKGAMVHERIAVRTN